MIEKFAHLIPKELENLSGSVFYSGRKAFQGKKDLYILGLNPGGSEMLHSENTIIQHTNMVLSKKKENWSEYKSESWENKEPGKYGLQPRILHLLNKLDLSPYEVPASNVCFVRSNVESKISRRLNEYAELCWNFHKNVIDTLEVKTILCFGNSASKIVKRKLDANELLETFTEINNRNWQTNIFRNPVGIIVVAATHPSRADWTNPNTDPSSIIKKYLSN